MERSGQSIDVGIGRLRDVLAELTAEELPLDELSDQLLVRLLAE